MPPDTQGLPWPEGDPEARRAAARRAAPLGAALEHMGGTVATTDAPAWSGTAATAFDGTVQADAAAVRVASAAFTQSAAALDELASALEAAQERVLEAARRLREARAAAAAAEASAAEDAALRAESAAAVARDELARVEAWAQREADDAVTDARAADQRAAGVLDGAAAATAPLGVTTGTPSAGITTGGLGPLGDFLTADLFNYWGGGPNDDTIPLGKMVKGGAFMFGTYQFMRAQSVAASWARVAPMAPGTFTELTAMNALARFPTFNNGFLGRGLARGMSAAPGLRGAGSWLSTASRATPVFRRLGIAGGAISTVMDAHHVIEQGNPVDAFQREGAGYVADIARTGFGASTTAFLIAPNPVTGGAVIVTGAVWLGAEAWDHREAIGDAVATSADWAWDHSLAGAAWNHREDIGAALDSGAAFAGDVAAEAGERWDQGVDMVGDGLSSVAEGGGDLLEAGGDLVGSIPTPW